jgi:hypothetical protein
MTATAALTAAILGLAWPEPTTQERFEALAKDLKFLPTGEMLYGRSDKLDRRITEKWTEPWYKTLAAISDRKLPTADLVALLKHKEPNVRALALAALFSREDPAVLPQMAALVGDKCRTVPDLQILRADIQFKEDDPHPSDLHPQTVGSVANKMVGCYLRTAGYSDKDFNTYWAARKDRKSCASWYVVRMTRATGSIVAFQKDRAGRVKAVREAIEQLPQPDRDWTLLYVACHYTVGYYGESGLPEFTDRPELILAARRIGPATLLELMQGKVVCPDPDLGTDKECARARADIALFTLKHAAELLRPQDAETLLAMSKENRTEAHWYIIAAAVLKPQSAKEWIVDGLKRYEKDYARYYRASLAAGLWQALGDKEIPFLVDWFYGEKVDKNPHSPQTGEFVRAIKGIHAPADRKLLAALANDKRLDKLDYQSLRVLLQTVNEWVKTPVIEPRALYPTWEKGGWSPESPADEMVLQEWRTKLRGSVKTWYPEK